MRNFIIGALLPLGLIFMGCGEENVQTTPFRAYVPQNQTCSVCSNQTNYKILPPPSPPGKSQIVRNIVTVNPKPICNCPSIPMVPANYFVTYESLNDYPITYKTKYTQPCSCY